MAKKGQVFKKYSPEFKLSVILDMLQNNLGYGETVRKYWDTNHVEKIYKKSYILVYDFRKLYRYRLLLTKNKRYMS